MEEPTASAFEATLVRQPKGEPGSKAGDEMGVFLKRDDGMDMLVVGGPDGYLDLLDQRVQVTGNELVFDDQKMAVARLGVPHFQIHTIEPVAEEAVVDEYAPTYSAPESFTAMIEIDDTAGSKNFQGVWLVVDGTGEKLLVAYRPKNWSGPAEGAHVQVTGRRYSNSPMVQQIVNAQHFAVDEITEITP